MSKKKQWRPVNQLNGHQLKYEQMIFDSGAGCTAVPARVGEGYPLKQDDYVGTEYSGAIEGMKGREGYQRHQL